MPSNFLPRNSGAHRIACKALYRSLLLQCPTIPLPASLPSQGVTNPLKHIVRKQFKRYINCTSKKILVKVLGRGYEAERLLRTAANPPTTTETPNESSEALAKIHTHLLNLHAQREVARQICLKPSPKSSLPLGKQRPRVWPYPDASKLLDIRPLPKEQLTGRRGLPKLAAANGVPFLRVKKPQSAYLGRVLRDKAGQKARRFDRLKEIEEGKDAAGAEGEWEGLLERVAGFEGGEERDLDRGKGWVEDVEKEGHALHRVAIRGQRRLLEMGRVMMGVEERERELWREERDEKRRAKLEEKKKRNGWEDRGAFNKVAGMVVLESQLPRDEMVSDRPRFTIRRQ